MLKIFALCFDLQTELRKAQTAALELRKEAQIKKQIADRKMK